MAISKFTKKRTIMNPVYLTKEEYKKLEKEIHHLKFVERPKVVQAIATARDHGDLKENAEYTAAKEKQVLLELKIQRLEYIQARTRIVDPKEMDSSKVHVGSKVTLFNINTEQAMKYILVSTADLDFYDMDVISLGSPVGKLILGKSVGDQIEFDTPTGKLKYKILEVM